jgi:hypothetical protein
MPSTTDTDELIATAELGDEAKRFLESDLGKCLLGMAQQEVESAREALETTSPMDYLKVRELQNQAWLGRHFNQWLLELLHKGEAALVIYKQQREF